MFKFLIGICLFCLMGCLGYSSKNSESIIQPKSIQMQTPIICPEVPILHGSLGIIRNGRGSISNQDVDMVITNDQDKYKIQTAIDSGYFLNVKYNTKRMVVCNSEHILVDVEIVKE